MVDEFEHDVNTGGPAPQPEVAPVLDSPRRLSRPGTGHRDGVKHPLLCGDLQMVLTVGR